VIKSNAVTLNNELCFICSVRIRFLRESIVIEFFNMNHVSRYYDAIFEQRAIEYYLQNQPNVSFRGRTCNSETVVRQI
jgi:hypothetical protein